MGQQGSYIVAIVGRPNVGKSTLFNKIIGKRSALASDLPGLTRDRNYGKASWDGRDFNVVDTGGFEDIKDDIMMNKVFEQASLAIEEADIIVLLTDGRDGFIRSDSDILSMLRDSGKRFLLVVNKMDDPTKLYSLNDFYSAGMNEIIPISAEHGIGLDILLDKIISYMPKDASGDDSNKGDDEAIDAIKIAVVGKPNTGKSSLVNKILNENRMCVSDIAGTTRDSIDTLYVRDDKKYIFIDTAGIRKKFRVSQRVEKFSVMMSMRSIERCDIALIVVDAKEGVTEQDIKIAGLVNESGRGAIVVLNKWDIVEKSTNTASEYAILVKEKLKYMPYAPVLTISALTGQRIPKIFSLIDEISMEQNRKIKTSEINKVIGDIVAKKPPASFRGKRIKFYYSIQVNTKPPTFMLFVNHHEGIHFSYTRYIINELRKKFGFTGTAIKIVYKDKERS